MRATSLPTNHDHVSLGEYILHSYEEVRKSGAHCREEVFEDFRTFEGFRPGWRVVLFSVARDETVCTVEGTRIDYLRIEYTCLALVFIDRHDLLPVSPRCQCLASRSDCILRSLCCRRTGANRFAPAPEHCAQDAED